MQRKSDHESRSESDVDAGSDRRALRSLLQLSAGWRLPQSSTFNQKDRHKYRLRETKSRQCRDNAAPAGQARYCSRG